MNSILTLVKKELRTFFDNPTAYVVLLVFLFLWEYLFFRNAFLMGEASLRALYDLFPWLLLILIPALTMGALAQEKSEGTLEWLLTHPLSLLQLVAGKFLALLLFATLVFSFALPLARTLSFFGNLDWGVALVQFGAGVSLAAMDLSFGLFISSLFSYQIPALLVTVAGLFFLNVVGFEMVTASLPLYLGAFFERLSALGHFESMARGVLDVRDLWYFVSVTAIFLSLTYLQLLKQRLGNRRKLYGRYQMGVVLFIGIAVLSNLVGARIPGRIDLTQDHSFTLSPATKKLLTGIDDVVNITLYASTQLPSQLQPVLRDIRDTLRDYQTYSKGNVVVNLKDPADPKVAQEAAAYGIREMQFNVIGREEFQVKTGYLGLAITYGDRHEVLPFVQEASDLEYRLTGFIKKLTSTEKKKILFLAGHGEKSLNGEYQVLRAELDKQFDLEEFHFSESTKQIPDQVAAVVVAGPQQKISADERLALQSYLQNQGSLFLLLDAYAINDQMMYAGENKDSFADFAAAYGVKLNNDMVYDLRANENIQFGGGAVSYVLPYPFWLRVRATEQCSALGLNISQALLPWASSIALDETLVEKNGYHISRLLVTSAYAGSQTGFITIDPTQTFAKQNLGEHLMAVALEPQKAGGGRLVVLGDSDFLAGQFGQTSPENLSLGLGAISWLARDDSLAGLYIKRKPNRQLFFENEFQILFVKYSNLSLALLVPLGVGLWRFWRRRRLRQYQYAV